MGTFKTPDPAFVQIFPTGEGEPDALWITSFSSLKPGRVRYIPDIASALLNGVATMKIEDVQGTFVWPNLISYIPPNTIPSAPEAIAIVPDGFLVPGKSTGGLYVLTKSIQKGKTVISKNITLVAEKTGWFYHMVQWVDLDLDGLLDVVSARAKSNTFTGTFDGELVWLRQPSANALSGVWNETVLASGPDFIFTITDLNPQDSLLQLYAAQFFSNKVVLYDLVRGASPYVQQSVIIAKLKAPEDIHVIDLNLDGTLELLFNEHVGGAGGNVTSATIPEDYLSAESYVLETLATGFPVTESGLNQAAPGFLTPFYVNVKDELSGFIRPSILVAGDGSQSAYVMSPLSNPSNGTSYSLTEVLHVDGVIGIIAAGYLSSQQYTDFFVPDYDENIVYVYTYQP